MVYQAAVLTARRHQYRARRRYLTSTSRYEIGVTVIILASIVSNAAVLMLGDKEYSASAAPYLMLPM